MNETLLHALLIVAGLIYLGLVVAHVLEDLLDNPLHDPWFDPDPDADAPAPSAPTDPSPPAEDRS